jgi:uncharacterized RmlC-like cupin family protein
MSMTLGYLEAIMERVERGDWPAEPLVPVAEPFANKAGEIWNLAWGNFGSASLIHSVKGAVRSNHFHETDWHFIYVISGLMYYYWRPRGNILSTPGRIRCPTGALIFTPPCVEHATYFPSDCTVVTLNKRARDHASHESDLVRIDPPLVTNEVCPAVSDGTKCVLPYQHVEGRDFRSPIHTGDHEAEDGRHFSF